MNLLDYYQSGLWTDPLAMGMLPNYNPLSQLQYRVDDQGNLILYRKINDNLSVLTVDKTADLVLSITQDGLNVRQPVNRSGTTRISIVQRH